MWVCKNCQTSNSNNANFCMRCGARKPSEDVPAKAEPQRKLIPLLVISVIVIASLIGVLLFTRTPAATEDKAPEPPVTQVPTAKPEPTPWPVEGESTAGTKLINIVYDKKGRILSLTELNGEKWIDWIYVYTKSGSFLYRKQNIGGVKSTTIGKNMPGTTTGYNRLDKPIENCVGFTIKYHISNVRGGDGLGKREVMIQDDSGGWTTVGMFDYNSVTSITKEIDLSKPVTIKAFGATRVKSDNKTHFAISQQITDIWVADYDYVELAVDGVGISQLGAFYQSGEDAGNQTAQDSIDLSNALQWGVEEGVTWVIDNNGLLTVYGKGEFNTPDEWYPPEGWEIGSRPCDKIKKAVFCDGITRIGNYAFDALTLTSVTIPGSVKEIGAGAFMNCIYLQHVDLSEGLTSIESDAFNRCSYLSSINFPASLKRIESGTFAYCGAIKTLTFPAGITHIGDAAFMLCEGLTDIYYGGTQKQWNKISGINMAFSDVSATIHLEDGAVMHTADYDPDYNGSARSCKLADGRYYVKLLDEQYWGDNDFINVEYQSATYFLMISNSCTIVDSSKGGSGGMKEIHYSDITPIIKEYGYGITLEIEIKNQTIIYINKF